MFKIFQRKEKKDPICGMIAKENFISKYGEKFCSDGCLKEIESKNQIASDSYSHRGGCCH